ncbi:hypothetical protein BH10ACT11_BH10ACT11_02540 [soil metagenome]
MSSEMSCGHIHELVPELALGIADGEERALALEHLVACPDCSRYLDELSATTDELLLLAPQLEPPTGFEARVAEAITPPRSVPSRWRRPLVLVGTALATGAAVAVAMLSIFHDDRQLASDYRQTLSEANGSYFAASELKAPGGRKVGNVFQYEGKPSFLLVSVAGASDLPDGNYDCHLVAADGRTTSFGTLKLRDGEGSYGRAVEIPIDDYREVSLVGPGSGTVISAPIEADEPTS